MEERTIFAIISGHRIRETMATLLRSILTLIACAGLNAAPALADPSVFCGDPSTNSATDRGTFLWRDCAGTGNWQLEVSGGGSPVRLDYRGSFTGTTAIAGIAGQRLEPTDSIDNSSPMTLLYHLIIYNRGIDIVGFNNASNICFEPQTPTTLPVFLGSSRIPLAASDIDLSTGLACDQSTPDDQDGDGLTDDDEVNIYGTDPQNRDTDGGGVDDGTEVANGTLPLDPTDDFDTGCGRPDFNAANETAYFLWKDCNVTGTETWHIAVTGGGPFNRFLGNITSNAPLTPVAVDLEGPDTLDSSPGDGVIDFVLGVAGSGKDEFTVDVPRSSNTCFTAESSGFPSMSVPTGCSLRLPSTCALSAPAKRHPLQTWNAAIPTSTSQRTQASTCGETAPPAAQNNSGSAKFLAAVVPISAISARSPARRS